MTHPTGHIGDILWQNMSDAEMLGTLDPSAEGGTGEGGPEVQVPGLKMDQSELFIAPNWPIRGHITDLDVSSGQYEPVQRELTKRR
mgnify:CR=1 FL=1